MVVIIAFVPNVVKWLEERGRRFQRIDFLL